jgi:hypothetical protein
MVHQITIDIESAVHGMHQSARRVHALGRESSGWCVMRMSMDGADSASRPLPLREVRLIGLTLLLVAAPWETGAAQSMRSRRCRVLCTPVMTLMPALLRTHVFGGPEVRSLATGQTHRLPGSSSFELIVGASSRTSVPHVSLFGSAQWLPNATEARNPFTLYTAS